MRVFVSPSQRGQFRLPTAQHSFVRDIRRTHELSRGHAVLISLGTHAHACPIHEHRQPALARMRTRRLPSLIGVLPSIPTLLPEACNGWLRFWGCLCKTARFVLFCAASFFLIVRALSALSRLVATRIGRRLVGSTSLCRKYLLRLTLICLFFQNVQLRWFFFSLL